MNLSMEHVRKVMRGRETTKTGVAPQSRGKAQKVGVVVLVSPSNET